MTGSESPEFFFLQVAIKLLRCFTEGKYDPDRARKVSQNCHMHYQKKADKLIQRLSREVNILNRAHHSNVVKMFGTSYHMGGRPAIIMPWYRCGDAQEYLHKTNPGANKLDLVCVGFHPVWFHILPVLTLFKDSRHYARVALLAHFGTSNHPRRSQSGTHLKGLFILLIALAHLDPGRRTS
jgi:Protein tyrosine and serine/threonine kinase